MKYGNKQTKTQQRPPKQSCFAEKFCEVEKFLEKFIKYKEEEIQACEMSQQEKRWAQAWRPESDLSVRRREPWPQSCPLASRVMTFK